MNLKRHYQRQQTMTKLITKVITLEVTPSPNSVDKDMDDFIDDVSKLCNEWNVGLDFKIKIIVDDQFTYETSDVL